MLSDLSHFRNVMERKYVGPKLNICAVDTSLGSSCIKHWGQVHLGGTIIISRNQKSPSCKLKGAESRAKSKHQEHKHTTNMWQQDLKEHKPRQILELSTMHLLSLQWASLDWCKCSILFICIINKWNLQLTSLTGWKLDWKGSQWHYGPNKLPSEPLAAPLTPLCKVVKVRFLLLWWSS